MSLKPLGRHEPPDWAHVEKYALAALAPEAPPTYVPVAMGVNWYTKFDSVWRDHQGKFWVDATPQNMGTIRGGHCFCLEPAPDPKVKGDEQDSMPWWTFYNQSNEGACVGFGCSRVMSLLNRHKFDPWWLYDKARTIDGDPDPNHEGSTVRAGLEILRTIGIPQGHGTVAERTDQPEQAQAGNGISAYRWATSAQEVLNALGTPNADHVVILNSWGRDYPHRVNMEASVLDILIQQNGEAGVVTDR